MFATSGFQVVGVDIDERVVHRLRNGDVHIQEPGLEKLVRTVLNAGNYR
jgi:UDP-N-acetyl-D-mannosaminuronic acid dehydrogenase